MLTARSRTSSPFPALPTPRGQDPRQSPPRRTAVAERDGDRRRRDGRCESCGPGLPRGPRRNRLRRSRHLPRRRVLALRHRPRRVRRTPALRCARPLSALALALGAPRVVRSPNSCIYWWSVAYLVILRSCGLWIPKWLHFGVEIAPLRLSLVILCPYCQGSCCFV
jgi:hypothetical protein